MLELIRMSTSMASPYKSLSILVKRFFEYVVYEIFLWPESWRVSLHIYLLSFPRFWTLSIEQFWFLFWSILNGVTLKTSNRGQNSLGERGGICLYLPLPGKSVRTDVRWRHNQIFSDGWFTKFYYPLFSAARASRARRLRYEDSKCAWRVLMSLLSRLQSTFY